MRGLPPAGKVPVPLVDLQPAHLDQGGDKLLPGVDVLRAFLDQVKSLHRVLGEAILSILEEAVEDCFDVVLQQVEVFPNGSLENLKALH